jgi:hypothetical protein
MTATLQHGQAYLLPDGTKSICYGHLSWLPMPPAALAEPGMFVLIIDDAWTRYEVDARPGHRVRFFETTAADNHSSCREIELTLDDLRPEEEVR